MIKKSAGLVIIKNEKILLIKPRGIDSDRHWSIPKGYIESADENIIQTAIRETYEETGTLIPFEKINVGRRSLITYLDAQNRLSKIIFYFVVEINDEEYFHYTSTIGAGLNEEVEKVEFLSYKEIREKIYYKQLSVVNFLKRDRFNLKDLQNLLDEGYIKKTKHPKFPLWIYNYTNKTKTLRNWNYTTLNARGLILDIEGKIIARSFEKFFEYDQLYIEIKKILPKPQQCFEKLDGALGIAYKYNNSIFISTKSSFNHYLAILANDILINDYNQFNIIDDQQFLFEIISRYSFFTLINGLGKTKLFLIAPITSKNNIEYNFESPRAIKEQELEKKEESEGVVLMLEDQTRIKIKTTYFKKRYDEILKLKKTLFFAEDYNYQHNLSFGERDYMLRFQNGLFSYLYMLYTQTSAKDKLNEFILKNYTSWF
ncbi:MULTISPECIES: NUDIX domain-containing protein [unclassified Sphingobacterium]|uniref:NUDIX domain-containing protein n=1 Tax=unclassified Sphingobacterium TaxID=2609468 RepID=UPI0025FD14C1|nr:MULTISPECIES: NUDIX domain-containing protein [unclassified Sphingobacterium]